MGCATNLLAMFDALQFLGIAVGERLIPWIVQLFRSKSCHCMVIPDGFIDAQLGACSGKR